MSRGLRILIVASAVRLSSSLAIAGQADEEKYQALVQRVKRGDLSIDFRELRLTCIGSSLCEPRGTKADLGVMTSAEADHQFKKVIEVGEKLIERGFVNLEAHATLAQAYAELGDAAQSKFHLEIVTALMRSIMRSGDGKTTATAFEVICDREEYLMLSSLGLPYFGSAVASVRIVKDGPHTYDRWDVQKSGQKVVVFFNVDNFSATKSRVTDK